MHEVIAKCKLACESEAVAMGFDPQLGLDVYEGCVQDDLQGWDNDRFLSWVVELRSKYNIEADSDLDRKLMDLYTKCSEIMGRYAELFRAGAL